MMSKPKAQLLSRTLYKQKSWSPDASREEVWLKRKANYGNNSLRGTKSVTDDDLEELKGCIELGFGFGNDSPDLNPKLSETLPALELYCAFNKQYVSGLSRSVSSSSIVSDGGSSTSSLFDTGGDPETVKARLKQWAQLVACSVKQFGGEPPHSLVDLGLKRTSTC